MEIKIIEAKLEYYPVPKTVLESQITSLAVSYKEVFERIKEQYEEVLKQTKHIALMSGINTQSLD